MTDHSVLRAWANDPRLIETEQDLAELRSHVAHCPDCAALLAHALEFESQIVGPLRATWHHLSTRRLRALKAGGFVPTADGSTTLEQWHVVVCSDCGRRFQALGVAPRSPSIAGRLRWAAGVAAILIVSVISVSIYQRHVPPQGIFRSPRTLDLVSPADGALVAPWQQFRWQSTGIEGNCSISFRPAQPAPPVSHPVSQSSYILTRDDAALLTVGARYDWSIRCAFADETGKNVEIESSSRRFQFVHPPASTSPRDTPSPAVLERVVQDAGDNGKQLLVAQSRVLDVLALGGASLAPQDTARLFKLLGDISFGLDRKADARERYETALAVWSQSRLVPDLLYARILTNYAQTLQLTGQLDESLRAYLDALDILRHHQPDTAVMEAHGTAALVLGTLYRERGIPLAAKRAYEEALEVDRALQDDGRMAEDLTNLGNVLVDELDSITEGLPLLREAAAIQRRLAARGKRRVTFGDTLDGLATAYTLAGNAPDALALYNEVLVLDKQSSDGDRVLQTQMNIAELHIDLLKDPTGAVARFRDALNTIGRIAQPDPDNTWRVFTGLGRALAQIRRLDEAEGYIRQAIRIVDDLRGSLSDSQSRRHFGSDRGLPYFDLAMLEFQRNRPAEVFSAVESGRAISFREVGGDRPPEPPVDLATFQRQLSEADCVLSYSLAGPYDPVLLLAISRSTAKVYPLGNRRGVEQAVAATLKRIQTNGGVAHGESQTMELSRRLLPPEVWQDLRAQDPNTRRVTISADGSLQNFPFEILKDPNGRQDGASVAIGAVSFVPSLSWWAAHRARLNQRIAHRDALIIADPAINASCVAGPSVPTAVAQNGLSELPSSVVEARMVGRYASSGTTVLARSSATLANFRLHDLRDYKIIHFATHAVATGRLDTSFLLLSCTVRPDVLAGDDILKLNLEGQLIILSACDTSTGRDLGPEGVDSLVYGFLKSGAFAVVATRWKIRDDIALRAMSEFYRELTSGQTSVREALQRTEHTLAASGLPIRDWAAFGIIGISDFTPSVRSTVLVQAIRVAERPIVLAGVAVLMLILFSVSRYWRTWR